MLQLRLLVMLMVCRWAVILAFDVRVERDAQEMADNVGVKIFSADIIYHLFDSFLKHREVRLLFLCNCVHSINFIGTSREKQAAISKHCCFSM